MKVRQEAEEKTEGKPQDDFGQDGAITVKGLKSTAKKMSQKRKLLKQRSVASLQV